VGAQMGFACVGGACLNVRINLPGILDAAFVEEMKGAASELETDARRLLDETLALVLAKIEKK